MIFTETPLKGAFIIELEKRTDERGFFARTFCRREFEEHGLNSNIAQCNMSLSLKKGTLRGMHYQLPPHAEVKLVRCVQGAIFDVIVDIRDSSPTYKKWFGAELSSENFKALYVPEGFAHGFVSLQDNSIIMYQVSQSYAPNSEGLLAWDDPSIGIKWPNIGDITISDKDMRKQNPNGAVS